MSTTPSNPPALHCPRCGYNLAVVTDAGACPECGLAEAWAAAMRPAYRAALHWFAVAFVLVTFALIVLGGTVTSKGAGLAVPDWPTTYDYNMFLFPPSMWKGGVFYEHTHRLLGSVVGMMAIAMAVWLGMTEIRNQKPEVKNQIRNSKSEIRNPSRRPWLFWLSVGVLVLVIVQGVMGGLRVTEMSITLAILHGITAQIFLCSTVLLAAATGKWWVSDPLSLLRERAGVRGSADEQGKHTSQTPSDAIAGTQGRTQSRVPSPQPSLSEGRGGQTIPRRARAYAWLLLTTLFFQLILGAAMRHTESGLAIPDFPTAYGQLIPPLNEADIHAAVDAMPYEEAHPYYSPAQVGVHFAHRIFALLVVVVTGLVIVRLSKLSDREPALIRPMLTLVALLAVQIGLGVAVIWSIGHPEFATAHQATGAAILAVAALLAIRVYRLSSDPLSPGERDGVRGSPADEHGADRQATPNVLAVTRSRAQSQVPSPQPSPQGRGGRAVPA
ncbi:MAG: COX15/CtaA family protein [Phycisphaeraceae bacterium]